MRGNQIRKNFAEGFFSKWFAAPMGFKERTDYIAGAMLGSGIL